MRNFVLSVSKQLRNSILNFYISYVLTKLGHSLCMSKISIIEQFTIAVIFLEINTKNIKSYIFNISELLQTFVSIEKSFKTDCGSSDIQIVLQCHYKLLSLR